VPVLETALLTSSDGTRVCYRTLGEGPLLVIAHGAFSTSDDYVPVAVRLASSHRVVLVDRRGYRGSEVGPGPATFAQDAEDLLGLLRLLGPHGAVFGHSAGALAALHAARAAPELVRALILYEPPILFGGPDRQPLLDRYRDLRAAGEDGAALVAFTAATTAMPEDVVRRWIDAPGPTPRMAGVVAGVGRDLEATVAFLPDFEPWRAVPMPVTLLVGSESPHDPLANSVRRLSRVLPRSTTVVLPGQEQVAHVLDPDLLAAAIRTAFRE
jgi:pimeloyl-ACP methyl ester carboxylesterase